MRQKMAVKFEALKIRLAEGQAGRNPNEVEKNLVKQLEAKEAELKQVQEDIERVKGYADVKVQPKDITRDLENVKEFIQRIVTEDHF